jgi:protocatechuate 3,4-dioxygenase beta subunit
MSATRRFALLILIVILAGAGAAPALAGEYTVQSCNAALGYRGTGWAAASSHPHMAVYDNCAPAAGTPEWNTGLVTRNGVASDPKATVPQGAYSSWTFRAPAGATLSRISYHHEFCGWSGFKAGIANAAGGWLHAAGPLSCGTLVMPDNTLALGGATAVQVRTECVDGPCKVGGALYAYGTINKIAVTISDTTKPSLTITGGSATTPGWKRGPVTVSYRASDNTGISTVQLIDNDTGTPRNAWNATCSLTQPKPCPDRSGALTVETALLGSGPRSLAVTTTDRAGNSSAQTVRLNVDNEPPGPPLELQALGGTAWRQANSFTIAWRNPSQGARAPIAGVRYAVCPASATASDWTHCTFGGVTKPDVSAISAITVPRAGEWNARVWLVDAAGNETRDNAQSVALRLDDTPPSVRFGPIDANDPTRIEVIASDAVSPLSRAEVEIQRHGRAAWLPLATIRSRTGFVARLDDEHLEDGLYDLRARVFDSAGNERSTTVETSGRRARRMVPARIDTRLVAGQPKLVRARGSGRHKRTRRIIVVRPTVDFGRTIPIRGRLTTPGKNPVANASIEVWEQISVPGAPSRRVALIGTDGAGRFKFKALRGPSRVIRFRYVGSPLVRARTAEVEIQVRATTTFRTDRKRVVNGEDIVLSGRVLGQSLPSTGKLVQLQAYSRGRWITFATPRADPTTGRWSYRYRFTSTRGTVRYRFRARVPREAGFPYTAGTSRLAHVVVRGL